MLERINSGQLLNVLGDLLKYKMLCLFDAVMFDNVAGGGSRRMRKVDKVADVEII